MGQLSSFRHLLTGHLLSGTLSSLQKSFLELKEETDKHTTIAGDLNTQLTALTRFPQNKA